MLATSLLTRLGMHTKKVLFSHSLIVRSYVSSLHIHFLVYYLAKEVRSYLIPRSFLLNSATCSVFIFNLGIPMYIYPTIRMMFAMHSKFCNLVGNIPGESWRTRCQITFDSVDASPLMRRSQFRYPKCFPSTSVLALNQY